MQVEAKNEKYSRKYFPDVINRYRREGNVFFFHTHANIILEVRVLSDRILRMLKGEKKMLRGTKSVQV